MKETTIPDIAHFHSPAYWGEPRKEELEVFQQKLDPFIPPDAFDAHAHLWHCQHLATAQDWPADAEYAQGKADFDVYQRRQQSWMGQKTPQNGLFFGVPMKNVNMNAENDFVQNALREHPGSRGLMLIKPDDDPVGIEAKVLSQGWAGFKVYHVFAERPDTQNAFISEFLPEWAWEIADRHGLAIMLHQVRKRSLSDADNQKTINEMCRKYSNAKLILAHAARGFCGRDTVDGVSAIADLENVYFDTSAICEAAPLEAILQTFGSSRLLYGSDFPVSEGRGRAVSLGDGFHWIYEWNQDSWPMGKPFLVGIESLLALRRACETTNQNDVDIENIFHRNARKMLRI